LEQNHSRPNSTSDMHSDRQNHHPVPKTPVINLDCFIHQHVLRYTVSNDYHRAHQVIYIHIYMHSSLLYYISDMFCS